LNQMTPINLLPNFKKKKYKKKITYMNSAITTERTKLITATSDHTLHFFVIQYLPLYFGKLEDKVYDLHGFRR